MFLPFIRHIILLIVAIAPRVNSKTSAFRSNDAFLRGMLTPDSQYMYITACSRSPKERESTARTKVDDDVTPTKVLEKARNAATSFAVRIQRHAFLQMPKESKSSK
eukprot:scaffold10954_cov74-Cyclotella_meneghiniana.AAC.7